MLVFPRGGSYVNYTCVASLQYDRTTCTSNSERNYYCSLVKVSLSCGKKTSRFTIKANLQAKLQGNSLAFWKKVGRELEQLATCP